MLKNRVREVRETLGRSQEKLVEQSGVSLRLLRLVETEPGYTPTGRVMVRLARALHVELGYLFWLDDDVLTDAPLSEVEPESAAIPA